MEIDKTTFYDLSIFNVTDEDSVFRQLNYTRTSGGRDELEYLMQHPYHELERILSTQETLRWIIARKSDWPLEITNGTLMVIDKYYTYNFDRIPLSHSSLDALGYKIFHGPDYSMVKYSIGHFFDLFRGMNKLIRLYLKEDTPQVMKELLVRAQYMFKDQAIQDLISYQAAGDIKPAEFLSIGHFLLYHFKHSVLELMQIYHRLDAYYGMATAVTERNMHFPTIYAQATPVVKVNGLSHMLLKNPVPYSLQLDVRNNFLFLTGANMAGKSTFIKAVGISVYLAHIGMAVPAESMELSLFDGLLSNIQVQDNILKGESYFYNEVQRIKSTVLKVADGKKWFILIDELFKGTNIEDAMNCSTAVIKGLLKIHSSLFVLSTHLYEIGDGLRVYPNIAFRYFETEVDGEQLLFSYQLKTGISNDRLGYLILKREKVIELLDQIPHPQVTPST